MDRQSRDIKNILDVLVYNYGQELEKITDDERVVLNNKLSNYKNMCEKTIELITLEDMQEIENKKLQFQISNETETDLSEWES